MSPGPRLTAFAVSAALACLSAGCGYSLSGKGAVFPQHIKVVAVLPFENRTTRPEIEQRVTEKVAEELTRRGRYRIVTDVSKADALVEGAITRYTTTPVEFSSSGRATRVEAVVTIQATVRDLTNDTVLWSQGGLLFKEQFDVEDIDTGAFFDQETIALDDIAGGAAGALVTSILEGF